MTMTDFKVGDLVVAVHPMDRSLCTVERVSSNALRAITADRSFALIGLPCDFRPATPEEIAAGRRLEVINESE